MMTCDLLAKQKIYLHLALGGYSFWTLLAAEIRGRTHTGDVTHIPTSGFKLFH